MFIDLRDPRVAKVIGIIIAAVLTVLSIFGVTIDVPIVDPTFPVE
jgi:hypothetical protein